MSKYISYNVESPEDIRDWIRAMLKDRYEAGFRAGIKLGKREAQDSLDEQHEKGWLAGFQSGWDAAEGSRPVIQSSEKPVDLTKVVADILGIE